MFFFKFFLAREKKDEMLKDIEMKKVMCEINKFKSELMFE